MPSLSIEQGKVIVLVDFCEKRMHLLVVGLARVQGGARELERPLRSDRSLAVRVLALPVLLNALTHVPHSIEAKSRRGALQKVAQRAQFRQILLLSRDYVIRLELMGFGLTRLLPFC